MGQINYLGGGREIFLSAWDDAEENLGAQWTRLGKAVWAEWQKMEGKERNITVFRELQVYTGVAEA